MKKTAFITFMFFSFFMLSNALLANADDEYAKAIQAYNSGNYKEAVKRLKEYVKKTPDPGAYYRIGYALYELGHFAESREYFREAYLIDPTYTYETAHPEKKKPDQKTP